MVGDTWISDRADQIQSVVDRVNRLRGRYTPSKNRNRPNGDSTTSGIDILAISSPTCSGDKAGSVNPILDDTTTTSDRDGPNVEGRLNALTVGLGC
jgi:hypothetical protein